MKKCVILVGMPASGKSTFLEFVDNPEFGDTVFVYSTDRYIDDQARAFGKTYNELFEDYIGKATTRMNALLDIAIKEGVDVYWDQTNLGKGKRRKIINRMSQVGYDVECVCFLPPRDNKEYYEWVERLESRPGKKIPPDVITRMENSFVLPSVDEGFSKVTFYDMYGEKIDTEYST